MTPEQQQAREKALAELKTGYASGLDLAFNSDCERPSLAWRGDSIVLGSYAQRWAQRAWLYETSDPRKLGFVNLRPLGPLSGENGHQLSDFPLVAEAFIAAPRHMDGAQYNIYLKSNFGEFYGEKHCPEVTCFSMPYRNGGGVCAHACLYMSMVMLSRLGPSVLATHEISFVNAQNIKEIESGGAFKIRGLRGEELEQILESDLVGGAAALEITRIRPEAEEDDSTLVIHLIHQYIRQGLPVIMIVDCARLNPIEWEKRLPPGEEKKESPHAVVVIGAKFRTEQDRVQPYPIRFIYHDPFIGPYMEIEAERLVQVARFEDDDPTLVAFLVPLPTGVNLGIGDVLTSFWRYAIRKTNMAQKPFYGWLVPPESTALSYSLCSSSDLENAYFGDLDNSHKVREAIRANIDQFPKWIWAVEVYSRPFRYESSAASAVYFFDATERHIDKEPYALVGILQDELFNCQLRDVVLENIPVRGRRQVRSRRIAL